MTVCLIGVRYPRADYFSDFTNRARLTMERLTGTPGCLSAEWWVTTDQEAVVSVARFTSADTFTTARISIPDANLDFGYDERERQPRQVVVLESAD